MTDGFHRRLAASRLLIQDGEPPMFMPAVLALLSGERVDDRPIEVEPVAGTPFYRIRNGRHRFFAAVAQGAEFVQCVIRGTDECQLDDRELP